MQTSVARTFFKWRRVVAMLAVLVLGSATSWAQTTSFLGLDGGFEGSATIDNVNTGSSPVASKWTKSNANITIANETTTVRSGANSIKVSSSTSLTARLFSPSFTISASTTKWVVQFYRRATSTANTVQMEIGNFRGGTEALNSPYGSVSTANTWEKATYSPTAATSATTAAADIIAKMLGTGGDVYLDDFCLYESSSGVDTTAPNAPTSPSVGSPTTSSLAVSWTAASGGVDGGGYMVVRGTTDPTTAPNVNGIYAVGNTVASGQTVAYVGTSTSFTDSGLTSGTQYFYEIYTYDKAYNYSTSASGNGTTTAVGNTAPTLTTQAASSPSTSGATLNGTVTANGGSALTDYGFYWSATSPVSTSSTKAQVGTSDLGSYPGSFTKNLTTLSVNTIYYYRAYANNGIGNTLGSSDVSFYTAANTPNAPTVGNPTATTLDVTIGSSDGNPAITTYAIKEAAGQFVQSGGTLGVSALFQTASIWGTKTVTGLTPSTGYSFIVEAKNGDGSATTSFSSAGTGTTSAGAIAPSVTTQAASSLSTSGATLNGTVTANGGSALTDYGFYWSATSPVTISSTKAQVGTSDLGSYPGSFTKNLTTLSVNTIYYYRAYANNSAGNTLDSADVSFYTLANTPSAPTVNGPTPNSLNVAITSGDGNPSTTPYAIQETTSGNYVQSSGSSGTLGASVIYKTASGWGTTVVTGLSPGTAYTFAVVATNGAGTATSLSSTASGTTQTTPLAGWYGPWSGTAASPLAAPTINANLSSAQLARVGLTGSSTTARYSSSGWNTTANYMTATLTAASGYALNLNSAALTGNWGSSSTGPASFDVRSSVDNYASSLGTINSSTSIAYTSLALPASGYNGLSSITFRFIGSATAAGGGSTASGGTGGSANLYVSGSVGASTITGAATASAFTTTYGTASTAQTFSVSGANLIGNITATAPTGFEVASDGAYGATATLTQSGGSASGTLSIRLKATAAIGSYNSKIIALTSTGASEVDITTASSGNTVSQATPTFNLSSSANPSGYKDSLTFTANGFAADVTGTVQFTTNGVNLGSTVTISSQSAVSIATAGLPRGDNAITAIYSGDGNYLSVTKNLTQTITNHPPVSKIHFLTVGENQSLSISAYTLASLDYDADGDPLTITTVSSPSTNGVTVSFDGTTIGYTPPANYVGADQFTYTISDGQGGTATCTNAVTVRSSTPSFNITGASGTVGNMTVHGYGIPGKSYDLQYSDDNMQTWQLLVTLQAAPNGVLSYTDTTGSGSRFYRFAVP